MKMLIYTFIALIFVASSTYGASSYCDPATGNMSNPGTSDSPWSTLVKRQVNSPLKQKKRQEYSPVTASGVFPSYGV